jgi:hypothetical protein
MMFSIGTGPSGVRAVKGSGINSQPLNPSCCLINARNFAIAGEPSGRGPSVTACFVKAKAAAPLKFFGAAPDIAGEAKWTIKHRGTMYNPRRIISE